MKDPKILKNNLHQVHDDFVGSLASGISSSSSESISISSSEDVLLVMFSESILCILYLGHMFYTIAL